MYEVSTGFKVKLKFTEANNNGSRGQHPLIMKIPCMQGTLEWNWFPFLLCLLGTFQEPWMPWLWEEETGFFFTASLFLVLFQVDSGSPCSELPLFWTSLQRKACFMERKKKQQSRGFLMEAEQGDAEFLLHLPSPPHTSQEPSPV